jgi:hypothetical protein
MLIGAEWDASREGLQWVGENLVVDVCNFERGKRE